MGATLMSGAEAVERIGAETWRGSPRGELASVLLERIREERTAASPTAGHRMKGGVGS
jgi:hypothetical protein